MSWSLLGRFFGVPLLIVTTIVSGAVAVVLLFGGPAAPQQQTIESLLQSLEASGGEKSAGVLLPREKELWQTALELSERLKKKSTELTDAEIEAVATRLSDMARGEIARIDQVTAFGDDRAVQQALRSARFEFILRALARTESPQAVTTLIEVVGRGQEPYSAVAMQELANLRDQPGAQDAVGSIVEALQRPSRPETLLVATTALSVLASPSDRQVTDALASVRLAHDGEVAWSAALALARLGDDSGKGTLLDMLDRGFWEGGERYEVVDETGQVLRYPMPPQRVDDLLVAAIHAGSNLQDADIWAAIEGLASDSSHQVRGAAMKALAGREARPGDQT